MKNTAFILSILDIIKQLIIATIPSLFAILLFKLSLNKDKKYKENQILENRMNSFYIPLYQRYMRGQLPTSLKSTINREQSPSPVEIWSELFDFLIDNIHFMNEESQIIMHEFNNQMVELMIGIAAMSIYDDEEKISNFDRIYKRLVSSLFKDYISICSRLGLPKPAINHF